VMMTMRCLRAIGSALIAIMMMLTSSGCNIIGPAAYIIEGPPTIEAQHTLLDVPTLVFIDDRGSVVSPSSLRRVIADKTSENLMVQKVVTTTISPQDAMSLTAQLERNSKLLSLDEIGRKVGARQVICVKVLQFDDHSGAVPQPVSTCRVHVIDIDQHMRTFPPPDSQEDSVVVQVKPRTADPDLYASRGGRNQVKEALAIETGDKIAKLFYKHERKDLGSSLTPK
jgi:hypothetical protein